MENGQRPRKKLYIAKTVMIFMLLFAIIGFIDQLTIGSEDAYWGTITANALCIIGCSVGIILFQIKKSEYTLFFSVGYSILTAFILLLYFFGTFFFIKQDDIDGGETHDFRTFFYVQAFVMMTVNILISVLSWVAHKELARWNYQDSGLQMNNPQMGAYGQKYDPYDVALYNTQPQYQTQPDSQFQAPPPIYISNQIYMSQNKQMQQQQQQQQQLQQQQMYSQQYQQQYKNQPQENKEESLDYKQQYELYLQEQQKQMKEQQLQYYKQEQVKQSQIQYQNSQNNQQQKIKFKGQHYNK